MKKLIPIIILAIIIIGGGAFYGGMKYAQNKVQGGFQNLRNLSSEERQQRLQQMGADVGAGFRSGNSGGSDFISGKIISKDDKSLTVKLPNGGSKIIFFSESTEISKFASGSANDLEIGKTITVNGTANQDGSITSNSIQIRPEMSTSQ